MKVLTIGSAMHDIFIRNKNAASIHLCTGQKEQSFIILEEGKKIEIDAVESFSGGGAVNTATSFARLGNTVHSCFKTGADADRDLILSRIEKESVNTTYTVSTDQAPTGTSFILPCPSKNCTILIHRGANLTLTAQEISPEAIAWCELVYITSLSGAASQLLPTITGTAKEQGKMVVLNPGTSQLTANISTLADSLNFADILILNAFEAQLLMSNLARIDITPSRQPAQAADAKYTPLLLRAPISSTINCFTLQQFFRAILDRGPQIVVVTNGAEGVYATNGNHIYFHSSIDTNIVSTLGAGDAFGSAFVSILKEDSSLEQALLAGSLNSAHVLQHIDTQTGLLTKSVLEQQMNNATTNELLQYPL